MLDPCRRVADRAAAADCARRFERDAFGRQVPRCGQELNEQPLASIAGCIVPRDRRVDLMDQHTDFLPDHAGARGAGRIGDVRAKRLWHVADDVLTAASDRFASVFAVRSVNVTDARLVDPDATQRRPTWRRRGHAEMCDRARLRDGIRAFVPEGLSDSACSVESAGVESFSGSGRKSAGAWSVERRRFMSLSPDFSVR
jgi:hypothetical protein